MNFTKLSKELPVGVLLEIGEAVCHTDYAVRYYYNTGHPKFYKNRAALEKAVRRAWTIGAFNHRKRIEEIVERYKD